MFKLTYEAYIMFGIAMGYVIFRMISCTRKRITKGFYILGLLLLLSTLGFFVNSSNAWFGGWQTPSYYRGLYALGYLETDFPEDADAIYWLKENIQGSPVVLEANGDSYTGYGRVSASTGLPTVLGWYVHEWLWRKDTADLNQKASDIELIYTSADPTLVQELLEQYNVKYIFVGAPEREKYADRLQHNVIGQMGRVVYKSEQSDTYILEVS